MLSSVKLKLLPCRRVLYDGLDAITVAVTTLRCICHALNASILGLSGVRFT